MAGNDGKIPTTTVHQSRLQVFQPTRRPKDIERIIETSWGSARIVGKLGQTHADMLEAIFYNAISTEKKDNGDVVIVVDPYKVRMSVGGGKKYSYSTLMKHTEDVLRVLIDLKIKSTGDFIMSHIIHKIAKTEIVVDSPASNMNGSNKRELWAVIISNEFMELIRKDLPIHYNPMLIAQLETGIAQAIVRHIFTHKQDPNGGWKIDYLLEAVGVNKNDSQAFRNQRRYFKKDYEKLKKMGILVEENRVKRIQACSKSP